MKQLKKRTKDQLDNIRGCTVKGDKVDGDHDTPAEEGNEHDGFANKGHASGEEIDELNEVEFGSSEEKSYKSLDGEDSDLSHENRRKSTSIKYDPYTKKPHYKVDMAFRNKK